MRPLTALKWLLAFSIFATLLGCSTGFSPLGTISNQSLGSQTGGATNSAALGRFYVVNGKVIGPDGSSFVARGINVADWAAVGDGAPNNGGNGTSNGSFLLQLLPGINMVRLNAQMTSSNLAMDAGSNFYNDAPSALSTFVQNMTNAQVVVVIEDHVGDNAIPAGSNYTDELQWYKDMASFYKDNPYVWFGTMNEPWGNPTAQVMQQEQDIYGAIRSTGNQSPVLLEISTPPNAWTTDWNSQGAYFQSMQNVLWDVHVYGLGGSVPESQVQVNAELSSDLQAIQIGTNITSSDGVLPIIIGEYGSSTSGSGVDVNGTETVIAVQSAKTSGSCAWSWKAGASDLIQNNGILTSFGLEFLSFLKTGLAPATWSDSDGS